MSDPLGLSIGTTNLVAVRIGNQPVIRRSVFALPDGALMSGFVERVGDAVPLVAADGSSHSADRLLVAALAELVDASGAATDDITVAVPAHWGPAALRIVRTAMRSHPVLGADGTRVRLVSDAKASLSALPEQSGLPAQGVVALVDFGGGGTSITLADAGDAFEPIDETTRHTEFSGVLVDQVLLAHVLDGLAATGGADPTITAAVASLSRLREQCRDAKERLSFQDSIDLDAELPGHRAAIRVTRDELEALIATPFTGVLAALDDTLQRNRIGWRDVAALVVVGGGAAIPFVRRRLAEHSGMSVIATTGPGVDAARGAAVIGAYTSAAEARTGMAPVASPEAPTGLAPVASADAPTGLAPVSPNDPTGLAPVAPVDSPTSETSNALAWSQDDAADEPLPFTGAYEAPYDTGSMRPPVQYVAATGPIDEPRLWQRIPGLVFGVAAAVAVVAVGGVAIALTSATGNTGVTEAPRTGPAPPPSAPQPEPVTAEAPPPPVETVTLAPVSYTHLRVR
ncbi:Hsp70 family protein, partial [Mycobacterium sp. 852002-51961_SCH5331710]|uniref:Hsp70 family protein n=1 Tax=Mycobacterium sp. 852002-51961_SCH5331710 TaxID=1834105 RepID=UPI000801A893